MTCGLTIRVLLAVLTTSTALSCAAARAQVAVDGCDFFQNSGGTSEPLQLVACMMDTEPHVGEPIRVFVALVNRGSEPLLTRARLDLGAFLSIRIEDGDGRRQEIWVGEPGHFDWEITDITLPRGGMIGRVINLACDQGGYLSADAPCFSELNLREPGVYRVLLSYTVLCGEAGCPDGHPWVGSLSALPLEFRLTN